MSFGISKRSLPCSLMVSLPVAYRSPTAAPIPGSPPTRSAKPFAGMTRRPWFPSWTFGDFVQHPNARAGTGVAGRVRKFSLVAVATVGAATVGNANELSIRAASQIGVIPAIGDLLDGEAVDLPSAAGDTNDPLRLSSFWPPISESEAE